MKKLNLQRMVRLLAVAGFELMYLPLYWIILIFSAWFFEVGTTDTLELMYTAYHMTAMACLTCIAAATTGFVSEWIRSKIPDEEDMDYESKAHKVKVIVFSNAILVPVYALMVFLMIVTIPGDHHFLALILYSALLLIMLIDGSKLHFKKYYEFFTGRRIGFAVGFCFGAQVLALILEKLASWPTAACASHMFWVFFLFFIIYCVTKNQSNIDRLMERRQHKMEHLPKRMRYYSLALTSIIFGIIILLFLLRGPLATAAASFWTSLGTGLLYIIRRILMAWVDDNDGPGTMGSEGSDASVGFKDAFGETYTSPWWDYILYPAVILTLIALIIVYRKNIAEAFLRIWAKALTAVRKFLLSENASRRNPMGESEYYFDAVETLDPESVLSSRKKGFRLKDWKKLYRKFNAMEPNNEKFRYGYALSMEWLRLKNVKLDPADTCGEIYKKAIPIFPEEQFAAVTRCYDDIRYGEATVQLAAVETLCGILNSLEK